MADTEKKISELTSAAQINTDDITVLSQGSAGTGFASVKATILAIANKIVSGINFSSALQTTDKTITGAINEVAQGGGGGASDLDDLSDVSITNPSNGQVLKYNSTSQEWENANESGGGSGGHTILDDSGNDLAQEDDLQFAGTYSEDDSINGKTVVNITREMTQADYDLLSADKKKGIIRITDDNYVCDGTEVKYSNGVSVKDKIDELNDKTFADMSTLGISDLNDLPNGIFFNSSTNITNLPTATRYVILSCQLLDSPVRKVQYGFSVGGEIYTRFKSGDSWTSWTRLLPV